MESTKLKSEIVLIMQSMNEIALLLNKCFYIYYHFIALVLNVVYVVVSINSYIQEIDVILQKN